MPDSTELPNAEHAPGTPSFPPPSQIAPNAAGLGPTSEPERSHQDAAEEGANARDEFLAALKQGLEQTRLPAHVKEHLVADLPSPEEQERLYRELRESGGFSFEQLLDGMHSEVEPQP